MPDYALNWSGGTIIVTEGTLDSSQTSLTLIGDGAQPWGRALNQNLVDLLQNFASATAPSLPLPGQLWYDTSSGALAVWNGSGWQSLAGTVIQGPEDRIHDSDDNTWVSTTDAVDAVTVVTGGSERIRVDSTGNVGIGTSLPISRLHVVGSGSLLRLATTADPGVEVFSVGAGEVEVSYEGTVDARIHVSPKPISPGEGVVSFFRNTSTTGQARLEIYDGSALSRTWASIDLRGDGYIGATGRYLGVGEAFGSAGASPVGVLHVGADTFPQIVVGNATSTGTPTIAFRDEPTTTNHAFVRLDPATGTLRLEKADGFAVLEIRQDGALRVSSAYTLPTDNGNPGDILVSDGFGGTSWQAPPFSTAFDSGVITQTGASVYTATHGLGAVPRAVRVTFVAVANNNGYAVGDEIEVSVANAQSTLTDGLLTVFASNVDVGVAMRGNVFAVKKDGTDVFVVSGNTSWGLRLRAWL